MTRPVATSRAVAAVALVATLAGCAQAPRPMYHWEGYPRQVYDYLQGTTSGPEEQLRLLDAQAEKARANGSALPPGFRAHRALLQLQLGRFDEAKQQLESEQAAFPESAHYMNFLLQRLSSAEVVNAR